MNNNVINGRHIPPHNIEAERSVLGALLLDNSAFHKVVDVGLDPEDFYREAHGKVYDVVRDLASKNQPVDIVTVGDALKNRAILEHVGGLAYITGLFEDSYSSAHVVHYSKIVKEKSILRRLISASNDIAGRAFDGVEDVEEFLDFAEKSIFDVTDSKIRNTFSDLRQILLENMQLLQELAEKKSTITGVPTGFTDFDNKTSGLHPGQLIIIAGRPAMGKTSFALNIAENAALLYKKSVAMFSLEMSKDELGFRFLSSLAKVDASKLKIGRLQKEEWARLSKASGQLSETKIYLDDTPALTVLEMRSRCRRLQSEVGLDLVIVDYIQLMCGSTKGGKMMDSREREISDISRSLKGLAKELRVPIVALSQLNRELEKRPNKRPMLSDLRESGAIEQDADIVSFVYRDEVYNPDSSDKQGIAEIIIAKHRSGSVGTIELSWQAGYTTFANLAASHQQLLPQSMSQPMSQPMPQPILKQQQPGYEFDDSGSSERPNAPVKRSVKKGGLDLPNY